MTKETEKSELIGILCFHIAVWPSRTFVSKVSAHHRLAILFKKSTDVHVHV